MHRIIADSTGSTSSPPLMLRERDKSSLNSWKNFVIFKRDRNDDFWDLIARNEIVYSSRDARWQKFAALEWNARRFRAFAKRYARCTRAKCAILATMVTQYRETFLARYEFPRPSRAPSTLFFYSTYRGRYPNPAHPSSPLLVPRGFHDFHARISHVRSVQSVRLTGYVLPIVNVKRTTESRRGRRLGETYSSDMETFPRR